MRRNFGLALRWNLALALLVLAALPARPQGLDPLSDTPYRYEVVLDISAHRHFTPIFRQALVRELTDQLKAALGPIAQVNVVDRQTVPRDRWPALWRAVESDGLAGLGKYNTLSPIKTHFVQLDYADSRYLIAARQHDGSTGFVSPIIREVSTPDRQLIGRQIGQVLALDFGTVGTLPAQASGDELTVTLQGSGIAGVDWQRLARKGEVFALIQIQSSDRGSAVGVTVPEALLVAQDDPKQGLLPCKLFHRYKDPLKLTGRVQGYRCVKLGTTTAPLRLQLVDKAGRAYVAPDVVVRAGQSAYPNEQSGEPLPIRDRLYQSSKSYTHVALLRLQLGVTSQFVPVPIFDQRVIAVSYDKSPNASLIAALELDRVRFYEQVAEALRVDAQRFDDISKLIAKTENAKALEQARSNLQFLDQTRRRLASDYEALRQQAAELPGKQKFDISELSRGLQALDARRDRLKPTIADLEAAIARAKDSKDDPRQQSQLQADRQAKALIAQGEYAKAIAVYERVLAEFGEQPQLRQQLNKLRQDLQPRDDEHRKAQEFLNNDWPTVNDVLQMKDKMPMLRQAIRKCAEVNDYLTLRRFVLGVPNLVEVLTQQRQALNPQQNPDDRVLAEAIQTVTRELLDVVAQTERSTKR
jgi:hypothetical protein